MGRWNSPSTIKRADAALELTGGHFGAAALLCGFTRQRFRNIINARACLKEKWGKKKRGRPPGRPSGLAIRDYVDAQELGGVTYVKLLIEELTDSGRRELRDFLIEVCGNT